MTSFEALLALIFVFTPVDEQGTPRKGPPVKTTVEKGYVPSEQPSMGAGSMGTGSFSMGTSKHEYQMQVVKPQQRIDGLEQWKRDYEIWARHGYNQSLPPSSMKDLIERHVPSPPPKLIIKRLQWPFERRA